MSSQPYLDVLIKEEDRMMRDAFRSFVEKEIMPVRQQIDDDKEHKIVSRILQGLTDLGVQKAAFPKEYGGGGASSMVSAAIMHEELARGDSGIATSATVTTWAFLPAIIAGNKAVLDRFAPEFCGDKLKMGCFAMTEPGGLHGGGGCDLENPTLHGRKIRTIAKLDGDEWVINGQKSWASNSGVADAYCLLCTTDPELGDEGIALIYVPSPCKGLSFGKLENKAGMQGDKNCPVYLDNVRVPKTFRAAGPGQDAGLLHNNVIAARILTGALAVGNAQAAFEAVLKYTGERIVANRPIRQHSICAGILADMAIGIETARTYYLSVAYMYDHPEKYGPPVSDFILSRASIAKVHAADVAVMVTNKAMELMGSYGYVREYDVEKYWRDCKIIQLWEGGAQLGRFDVCRGYYECNL
ncbi:MAG: acyl-CoA dehydrogenase family protein [Deltaproteobacteria bacterium]|nr:acyl-CoA dehydrogenase family protein [Deltaproteobacteria bacterium]